MKDCVFVVADSQAEETFRGFFARPALQEILGFRPFTFDIIREPNSDPGVYNKAQELVRPFQRTHHHAIIVLDEAWKGSPGAEKIQDRILGNLVRTGWAEKHVAVVVIVPELEAWILQERQPFRQVVGFTEPSIRPILTESGFWRENDAKAHAPKEAIEHICRRSRTPQSGALYRKIANQISYRECVDENFRSLCSQLSTWFPAEAPQ